LAFLSQLPQLASQVTEHARAVQVGVAWWLLQAAWQAPQFAASLFVLTSQPSMELALQSKKPSLHSAELHDPLRQTCAPVHEFVQVPQCEKLEDRSISQPSVVLSLQLP
jgi:hypothetical protein